MTTTGKGQGFSFDLGTPGAPEAGAPDLQDVEGSWGFEGDDDDFSAEPEMDHLDLDLGDLGVAVKGASPTAPLVAQSATTSARSSGTRERELQVGAAGRMGTAAWGGAAIEPEVATAPTATTTSAAVATTSTETTATATVPLTATATATGSTATAPVVRKIAFPTARDSAPRARPSRPRQDSKTQFSASVGTARPAFDSSEDLRESAGDDADALAAPEDLESLTHPDDLRPRAGTVQLDTSARELWERAQRAWARTSNEAQLVGEKGKALRQRLAREVRAAWQARRARLQAAAPVSEPAASVTAPSDASASREAAFRDASAPAPKKSKSPAAPAPTRTSASTSSSTRVGAAELRRWSRRLGPPVATLGLAVVVYVGGTHFLAPMGALGHSSLPDLGTLPPSGDAPAPTAEGKKSDALPALSIQSRVAENRQKAAAPVARREIAPHVEIVPLPEGLHYPGKGLIEVVTGEEEMIYVDGVFIGRGPLRRVPVSPGEHGVSIRNGGSERKGQIEVELTRTTRVAFLEPTAP